MTFICPRCLPDYVVPRGLRLTSWVWDKFCYNCRRCHLCTVTFSKGSDGKKATSSSIIGDHLNLHNIFKNQDSDVEDNTPPSTQTEILRQTDIRDITGLTNSQQRKLEFTIMKFSIVKNIPATCVSSDEFKELLDFFNVNAFTISLKRHRSN